MRRETLVYTLAGVVFGFVLGFMAASWDSMPRPVAAAVPPAGGGHPSTSRPAVVDPDEVGRLEALAARQPADGAPRVALGNLYMDHQRWEDAIRWYRDALAVGPDDPDVATDLGGCYVHAGRPAEGLAAFDRVLERHPDHRNARFNRGVALLALDRPLEAALSWEELLRRHPDDPQRGRLRGLIEESRASASATATPADSATAEAAR
jgi:cytochrome c-type biogenesis protein CcmH/NrfG